MTRLARVGAVLALLMSPLHAEQPLSTVVDVKVPGGETIRVALPAGMCGYPKEVRNRLSRFLSDGGEAGGAERLLGAAGDCTSLAELARTGKSVVALSMQLSMSEAQAVSNVRIKPQAFRRACFERFPARQTSVLTDELRKAVAAADKTLILGESSSLGLLDATRDAVFGGELVEIGREPQRILMVQVVACFSPAAAPLTWLFQATVRRDAAPDAIVAQARSVLDIAEGQVAKTIELNRGGSASR